MEHDGRVAAWHGDGQLEHDQAELEELGRQAREEEEAQRTRRERGAEELVRKGAEKKKPKLNPFDPNRRVSSWVEARPAQYAINKVNSLEYVELDYFTVRGMQGSSPGLESSINKSGTYALTRLDEAVALRPLAAQRASKNIGKNHELSWDEMLEAKSTMLHFIARPGA